MISVRVDVLSVRLIRLPDGLFAAWPRFAVALNLEREGHPTRRQWKARKI